MNGTGEITELLEQLAAPEADPAEVMDRLMPLVYGELKTLARSNRYRWSSRPGHDTTSLVHEAYVKLARHGGDQPGCRGQFFALASRAIRSILVDNARWHMRQKRGGEAVVVPASEVQLVSARRSDELLALDEALGRLEAERPELAQVVECRIFGGLTIAETADATGVSTATVKRRWSLARAHLYGELREA